MAKDTKRIADIGTDHGYLPIYFAQKGEAEKITASDVKKGPLTKAKEYAERYGVLDRIEFRLTDGLAGFDPYYDTVIIAGMGGETIVSILETAPWTKNGVSLILQPQSKTDVLLPWLDSNEYHIKRAMLEKDRGKLYLILSVSGGSGNSVRTPGEAFFPRELLDARDPLSAEYIKSLVSRFELALAGMQKSGKEEEKVRLTQLLHDFSEMEKEIQKW